MDLTQPVEYRTTELNDAATEGPGDQIVGNKITRVQWVPVGAHGYTEKRSAGDGRDASDIYLDGRRVILDGMTYGTSRGDLFDRLQVLKATFIPTGSFTDQPGSYGYVPLSYHEPTTLVADWPTLDRSLYINVRPAQGLGFEIVRDRIGGASGRGGGVPWRAVLDAKDPRVYVDPAVIVDFDTDDTGMVGTLTNRGDYPAPLNIMLVVAPQAKPGFFVFSGAGVILQLAIPMSANTQIIRYNGVTHMPTLEELGVERLAFDLLSWQTEVTSPLVPPGDSAFSWTSVWSGGGTTYMTIPMADGSRIFYSEAFA